MYLPKCGGCRRDMVMVQREGEFIEVKCNSCGYHVFVWDEN